MTRKTLTADGSTPWVFVDHVPAPATCALQGDFGGGTATLQWTLDTAKTPVTATDDSGDIARTAASIERFEGSGIYLRWTLAGATGPDLDTLIDA